MEEGEAVIEPRRLGHVLLEQARHRLVQADGEIELGVVAGRVDAELDLAVRLHEPMQRLLQQDMNEQAPLADSIAFLHAVLAA